QANKSFPRISSLTTLKRVFQLLRFIFAAFVHSPLPFIDFALGTCRRSYRWPAESLKRPHFDARCGYNSDDSLFGVVVSSRFVPYMDSTGDYSEHGDDNRSQQSVDG